MIDEWLVFLHDKVCLFVVKHSIPHANGQLYQLSVS